MITTESNRFGIIVGMTTQPIFDLGEAFLRRDLTGNDYLLELNRVASDEIKFLLHECTIFWEYLQDNYRHSLFGIGDEYYEEAVFQDFKDLLRMADRLGFVIATSQAVFGIHFYGRRNPGLAWAIQRTQRGLGYITGLGKVDFIRIMSHNASLFPVARQVQVIDNHWTELCNEENDEYYRMFPLYTRSVRRGICRDRGLRT